MKIFKSIQRMQKGNERKGKWIDSNKHHNISIYLVLTLWQYTGVHENTGTQVHYMYMHNISVMIKSMIFTRSWNVYIEEPAGLSRVHVHVLAGVVKSRSGANKTNLEGINVWSCALATVVTIIMHTNYVQQKNAHFILLQELSKANLPIICSNFIINISTFIY